MEVISTVRKFMDELQNMQQQPNDVQQLNSVQAGWRVTLKWERPSWKSIKINCNAAWCSSTKTGGIGVIARNHRGEIVGGFHGSEEANIVEYLEARVVLKGLS